ncbi:MAG: hypothetical protein A2521_13670 [Deltaproteobacteria bacterium RIFOXYD12_FULL_57_12]|nr:MAG: hypothetical protein A2521_13670 [Deltaproteobacteria bacterium RIFOXYD12_FULL_57_12]
MNASSYKDNIFRLLEQDGPFATGETAPDMSFFSPAARRRAQQLRETRLATRYRIIRNQLFEFLNIESFVEIQQLIGNAARRGEAESRAYALFGNMFGIEGTAREIISRVDSYSRTADGVVRYLKNTVLAPYAPYIEMTNEIDTTISPVKLLLIIFDDRYHKKARFEAKRKLVLMNLAGSIDQRERETDIENKFARFLEFLNAYVWSRDIKIGELEPAFLLSRHDPEDFSCTAVQTISCEEAKAIQPAAGQKLTLIKRRRFHASGREIPIYVTIRKKVPEAKVLKLLRKGEENPAVAVDDELGLMGVLEEGMDLKLFQKHLTESAIRAGSFMTLEDVSDTLADGTLHRSGSIGSSAKTPMFKFFARMGGMRVEFIVHTNRSYLNYMYQREVSHDEYEVKRIFDSGVAELLFPSDIYLLDMATIKDELLRRFRKRIEGF